MRTRAARNHEAIGINRSQYKTDLRYARSRSCRILTCLPSTVQIVRDCYGAYESGDRRVLEEHLSDNFIFYSPADVGIDRKKYFERCWPNAELLVGFAFKRLIEVGDEIIATYESTKTDGHRFRNTEVLTFRGEDMQGRGIFRLGPPVKGRNIVD